MDPTYETDRAEIVLGQRHTVRCQSDCLNNHPEINSRLATFGVYVNLVSYACQHFACFIVAEV